MRKKSVVYFLITLLLITFSSLYDRYMSKPAQIHRSTEILKMDFIAFPIKEKQTKISPIIRSFSNSLPKNNADENKGTPVEVKIIEKTSEIKKPLPEKTVVVTTPDAALKIGDSGDSVSHIQHRLNEYGYKLVEDGLFSALTYDAILNFQYRCNICIDGVVGPDTLEKLNITPTKNIEFNTKKTLTSATNYYIYVDLPKQRVNIFTKSEGVWILDRSLICSTGKASTPTVKGDFTIKDKGPMFRAGSNTICNYYTRFYGNYLFHTVLLDNKGNIQDGRLGTPLSHGCIRLAIDDAKYIYTSIPFGTKVSIH
jgi:lipoprotein-anchoring transpeptidase ErfK/SrfK